MRFFYFVVTMFIVAQLHAQDVKGYYITDSGQKVKGFFGYGDYNDTSSLKFKTSRNAQYASLSNDVVEYGVDEEKLKFEKHTVDIDVSGKDGKKNPVWLSQTVFLNVIVAGNATLYSYTKDYNTKFFFSSKGKSDVITELLFKEYKTPEGMNTQNTMFRQQLYNFVRCDGESLSHYLGIFYNKKELADAFVNYNKCTGSKSEIFGTKRDSGFRYTVLAGIYNLKLGVMDAEHPVDSQNNTTYGFGVEAAYTFPSEAWSLFAGLEYELMSSEATDTNPMSSNTVTTTYEVNSNALNFYFGPRYNFVINNRNKIFTDVAAGLSFPFGDINETTFMTTQAGTSYPMDSNHYELKNGFYFNVDLGYTFDEKYSIAFRYQTRRDFLDDVYSTYKTDITRLGVTLRYTFR